MMNEQDRENKKEEKKERNWRISFNENALKEAESSLGGTSRPLTEEVQRLSERAEILDRYDRFEKTIIPMSAYRSAAFENPQTQEFVEYGIRYNKNIHRREYNPETGQLEPVVILDHQRKSAEDFLKTLRGFGLLADIVGSGKTYEAGIVLSELAKRGIVSSLLLVVPDVVFETWIKVIEREFGLGKIKRLNDSGNWRESSDPDGVKKKNKSIRDDKPVILHEIGSTLDMEHFMLNKGEKYLQPRYPMIVKASKFIHWNPKDLKDKLFSVVVVDEAHHLCDEKESENMRAMYLLSLIMETKRKARMTYCLLLSATPHAGNLEDMFRLWYFVRCKGGNPDDFRPELDKHSQGYEDEHDYYFRDVCRGATTVMDFVIKEKLALLRGNRSKFVKRFRTYLRKEFNWVNFARSIPHEKYLERYIEAYLANKKSEASAINLEKYVMGVSALRKIVIDDFLALKENAEYCAYDANKESLRIYISRFWDEKSRSLDEYRSRFERFLANPGDRPLGMSGMNSEEWAQICTMCKKDFDSLYEGGKNDIVNAFLSLPGNEDIRSAVHNRIAYAYHHTVMGTIMVRRPSSEVHKVTKKKTIVNFLFFHTKKTENPKKLKFNFLDREVELKLDLGKVDYLNEPDAIRIAGLPDSYSLAQFVKEVKKNQEYGRLYWRMLARILDAFGLTDAVKQDDRYYFQKQGSYDFYSDQLSDLPEPGRKGTSDEESEQDEVRYCVEPVFDKEGTVTSTLSFKLEKLKQILRKHSDERVIVFFDYGIHRIDRKYQISEVHEALKSEFGNRLLELACKERGKEIKEKFDARSDAILIAAESEFTEGANFQKCSIIVNFEVTPNPIGIQQSIGRVFRYGQEKAVTIYSLADMQDLEGYVLAYFNHIQLMADKNGEAEILAGCNNENMVTIRCPRCNKNMMYLSLDDYDMLKAQKDPTIYCYCNEEEFKGEEPKLMTPIASKEYKCEKCGKQIVKGNRGYTCYSGIDEGTLVTERDNINVYKCSKLCLLRQCSRFTGDGPLAGKCQVVELYKQNPNLEISTKLIAICKKCKYRFEEGAERCYPECWVWEDGSNCSSDGCKAHHKALHNMTSKIGCSFAGKNLVFNEKFEAPCPCGGTMKSIPTKTFDNYIRTAFEQKQGESFCKYFKKEIKKVEEIYKILKSDDINQEDVQ